MNAQQLKNSILQEAIEGRLVPQDPNDEPASVLLDKIRAEKKRLVKEGKLKKKDLEETQIAEDEIPYKIPESWVWCKLNDICIFLSRGKSPSYSDIPNEYPVFAQKCNLKDGGISLKQARFLNPETVTKWQEEYHLRTDDVLVNSTGTGTVCRTRLFHERHLGKYPFTVPDSHVSVVRTSDSICSAFIYYLFNSKIYQDYWEDRLAGSTNQKELYIGVLQNTIIPLPPLSEQKRIVEKIEELLPKVEEYGKAQEALDKLNEELPERLKKSILQEAIEGRLVPQDPNDEPASMLLDKIRAEKKRLAKEGKLKKKDLEESPISEDEMPFTIPESWEWVRINDLGEIITGGTPSKQNTDYYGDDYPFFKPGDLDKGINISKSIDGLSQKGYDASRKLKANSVLVTCIGTIGKTGLISKEGACNQQINAIIPVDSLYPKYIYYTICSPSFQSIMRKDAGQTTLLIINKNNFCKLLFPLPPLAEQKRIVAKIEELFAEIDKLKM